MALVFGLDLGAKRVGVAKSDEMAMISEALETVTYKSKDDLLLQLKFLFQQFQPEKVVVGLPKTLKGENGPAAAKVLALADWLKEKLPGEWVFWDERFTTLEAERILLEADLSRAKRKGIRDRLAAQRILQSYLDHKKNAQ